MTDAPTPPPLLPLPGDFAAEPPPEPSAPARAWVDMDHDQAQEALAQLREWMGTVLVHERACQLLRPCWYRHPAAVQTLLDVAAAWRRAYRDAQTEAPALEWSQRHLPHLEERLALLLRQCTSTRHDPEPPALPRPAAEEVRAYLAWWTSSGRDPAAEPGGGPA